jgi:hypothetical protein
LAAEALDPMRARRANLHMGASWGRKMSISLRLQGWAYAIQCLIAPKPKPTSQHEAIETLRRELMEILEAAVRADREKTLDIACMHFANLREGDRPRVLYRRLAAWV